MFVRDLLQDLLVTAPLYSGVIQTINTSLEVEINSIVGSIRRIDALTVYKTLCATAESRWVKLWSLTSGKELIHWSATKTFMTSLFMNDTLIVTGSSAGIVKVRGGKKNIIQIFQFYNLILFFVGFSSCQIWDLNSLLRKNVKSVVPLTRISMKGVMHYPIKAIHQWEYTDLIIMAKYEAKRKKDKVKIVKVRGGRR